MLNNCTPREITLTQLVEHPGGHDGGDFPQDHTYGVAADGTLYYKTDYPNDPVESFQDEPPSYHVTDETREEALNTLQQQLTEAKNFVQTLQTLVEAFSQDKPFTVYFQDEPYDPFGDDNEQDPDNLSEEDDDDDEE